MLKLLSSRKPRIRTSRWKRTHIDIGNGMNMRRLMGASRRMMMSCSMRSLRDTRVRTITKSIRKGMIKSKKSNLAITMKERNTRMMIASSLVSISDF